MLPTCIAPAVISLKPEIAKGGNMSVNRAKEALFTAELIRKELTYHPDTGELCWLAKQGVITGSRAGTLDKNKAYILVRLHRHAFYAHRIIWLIQTGSWPINEIDHVDGDGLNNKWQNLRAATRGQNQYNHKRRIDNRSGFKGVRFQADRRKYSARIKINGHTIQLGTFETIEEAKKAYAAAAHELHGEFARLE